MKKIVIAMALLALCAPARSESLSTADGKTYNNITSQRVDPDGLYIEYMLPGGGVGMSKIKFSRLSPDLQKQYGFDANKAREYEAAVAKATEDYRQETMRAEQAAQAARQARLDQDEKAYNERILAMAQLTAAQADLARATGGGGGYGGSYGGDYGGLYAIPGNGPGARARMDYAPIVTPIPWPVINTPQYNTPFYNNAYYNTPYYSTPYYNTPHYSTPHSSHH